MEDRVITIDMVRKGIEDGILTFGKYFNSSICEVKDPMTDLCAQLGVAPRSRWFIVESEELVAEEIMEIIECWVNGGEIDHEFYDFTYYALKGI